MIMYMAYMLQMRRFHTFYIVLYMMFVYFAVIQYFAVLSGSLR